MMTRFQACPEAGKVSLGTYLCRKFAGVTVLLWLLEVAYSNPDTALIKEMVLRHIDTATVINQYSDTCKFFCLSNSEDKLLTF